MYATNEINSTVNKNLESNTESTNIVTNALRTLRLNKSAPFSEKDSETILNEEKCRRIYSLSEVSSHDTYDDCWIVIYDRVYNVTEFLKEVTKIDLMVR